MKPILFLDFDGTLFNTKHFIFYFWDIVQTTYGINPQDGIGRLQAIYEETGNTQSYDLEAHMHRLGLDLVQCQDLVGRRVQNTHQDFLFSDVASVINVLVRRHNIQILTIGQPNWQRYKLSLCPQLKGLAVTIIQEDKGAWLSSHKQSDSGWLVDDKPIRGSIPNNFIFIQIDRNKLPHSTNPSSDEPVISSLPELEKYLYHK